MKKIISVLVLVVAMGTMLTACGKFTCDSCGEKKSGKKYTIDIFGEELDVCSDCNDEFNEGMGELEDSLNELEDSLEELDSLEFDY